MKISVIGSGNLAWHLSQALENSGHFLLEIHSRDPANARHLVSRLYDAAVMPDLDFSESDADIIFLAVPDDAIADVLSKIVLPENVILVHTSGNTSLDELNRLVDVYSDVPVQTGVFYPLQTFSKTRVVNFGEIPICVESLDQTTESTLTELAKTLSEVVYLVSSQERKILHLAAVFACNFTNNLLSQSKSILDFANLDFTMLHPLIRETCQKALSADDPKLVQTGPAIRRDSTTMQNQQVYLSENHPHLLSIYQKLSQSVIESSLLNRITP